MYLGMFSSIAFIQVGFEILGHVVDVIQTVVWVAVVFHLLRPSRGKHSK